MRRVLAIAAALLLWPAFAAALDIETLHRQLLAHQVDSVERALGFLPLALRTQYTLVFNSRSLQQASMQDPRVILFGADARLVVTFNGHPSQRGYDTLELMQYDEPNQRFVYREMQFTQGAAGGTGLTLSEPNPEKCLACHGHPARPIWDTYPVWPGVYGQRFQTPLSASEAQGLQAFIAAAPTHPRYRALLGLSEWADPNTYAPSARFLYAGNEGRSPNAVLTRLLGELNLDAMVGEIAQAPDFERVRYALLATLSRDCGSLKGWIAPRPGHPFETDLDEFAASSAAATQAQMRLKALRVREAGSHGADASDASVEMLTEFRYLVERALKVPTSQWTTALEKGTFDFSAPESTAARLHDKLLAAVAKQDPRLADLAGLRHYGAPDKYCRYLHARSPLVAVDAAGEAGPLRTAGASGPATSGVHAAAAAGPTGHLSRCAACHTGVVAPKLPFDAPQQLAALLPAGRYPRGSLLEEIRYRLSSASGPDAMPRGYNLSEPERAELQQYFEALARTPQRE